MSPNDDDVRGKDVADIQLDYFLRKLVDAEGRYPHRERGLKADPDSVVLFQLRKEIIASARFNRRDYILDGEFKGALHFKPETIRVFDPVSKEIMGHIWPKCKNVWESRANAKLDLSPECYEDFEKRITNIQSPRLWLQAADAEPDPSDEYRGCKTIEPRASSLREILRRRGQERFRNGLRARYGVHCLVTGCTILDLLEAAHIRTHQGADENSSDNGLLLRADIHTLFDLNLLGIEPTKLRIELHPDLCEDENYRQYAGRTLQCPKQVGPSEDALRLRYDKFRMPRQSGARISSDFSRLAVDAHQEPLTPGDADPWTSTDRKVR